MMNSVWDLALGSTPVSNPGAAASRSVHVELTSQQRRLRHLRSIAARNIVNRNHSPLLDTYFTLHLCSGKDRISRDFYKSEVIRDSLNPTWRSLDFAMLPDLWDTSVSCFVVRIWGGREEQYQLLIEWKVNLDGLRYTGQQIRSRCPNEIIFGLNDGYYAADLDQKNSEKKKNSLLQVDQSSVRNSYSVFSLLRLHTAQKAIKQTQVTVQKIGKEIEEKLRTTAACTERKKERECMQLRIGVLRSEVERQRKALLREREALQKERVLLQKKEEAFSCKHQTLDLERDTLTDLQKDSTAKRELFLKSSAQLTFRCRQLLSELSYIYPIDTNSQSDFVICGVKLPNSEDFQAKDDGSLAVALGYTAHLVLMISCFLQIPLRYPIMHRGSRSSVRDTITDKLSEKEREFPLYPRGERFHFEYGVYLLNKNIAQLRYQHGLSTPDLRQTLPNLKNFLEHGLLVRCDRHHVSSSIPVPVRSHLSVSQVSFPESPEEGKKKRRSHKLYDPVVTPIPVTSAIQEAPPDRLDVSVELENSLEEDGRAEAAGTSTPEPKSEQYDPDAEKIPEREPELSGEPSKPECVEENLQHQGAMNGSAGVTVGAEVCCSVEQAEEIMGTEATGLGLGSRLEDFPSIPVEHAVAVESDDQVLGELENFEEFSKRIYALSENPSSFRRPRKNSDK
ncbi:UV radiation resistance-associated gene protein isoform X2 [Ictalurus punctatus]|uniref:UV radiation resistance-associated gene protein isoform X2 n=1 Tax=Ictalurus punctatus TaxID=7998 RepID=A0A9F7RHV5_ICTPU|nr:UV radiation resistance-associated gene protein isoform X2 [Ictalurus punctatus]